MSVVRPHSLVYKYRSEHVEIPTFPAPHTQLPSMLLCLGCAVGGTGPTTAAAPDQMRRGRGHLWLHPFSQQSTRDGWMHPDLHLSRRGAGKHQNGTELHSCCYIFLAFSVFLSSMTLQHKAGTEAEQHIRRGDKMRQEEGKNGAGPPFPREGTTSVPSHPGFGCGYFQPGRPNITWHTEHSALRSAPPWHLFVHNHCVKTSPAKS